MHTNLAAEHTMHLLFHILHGSGVHEWVAGSYVHGLTRITSIFTGIAMLYED